MASELEKVVAEMRAEIERTAADPDYTSAAVAQTLQHYADRLAAMGWRPIEDAPRDGRQLILLLTPSRFPQVAFSNTWWTSGFSVECTPTHWMPIPTLPAPPEGAKP